MASCRRYVVDGRSQDCKTLVLLLVHRLLYTKFMNQGNEMPNIPRDRFEIPKHLIDDINNIGVNALASVAFPDTVAKNIAGMERDNKSDSMEKRIIVELLNTIIKPSNGEDQPDGDGYGAVVETLGQMGYSLDSIEILIGLGYSPEMIADKMIEEAGES